MATIPFIDTLVPEAYHGTSDARAKAIQTDGKFKLSRGPSTYYGDGVYFFENDIARCLKYAHEKCKEDECPEFSIIRALIKLGCCLDLSKSDHEDIVRHTHKRLADAKLSQDVKDPVVFNFVAKIMKVDTIRVHRFGSRGPVKLYKGSRLFSGIEVVLVVRNVDLILHFEVASTGACPL